MMNSELRKTTVCYYNEGAFFDGIFIVKIDGLKFSDDDFLLVGLVLHVFMMASHFRLD